MIPFHHFSLCLKFIWLLGLSPMILNKEITWGIPNYLKFGCIVNLLFAWPRKFNFRFLLVSFIGLFDSCTLQIFHVVPGDRKHLGIFCLAIRDACWNISYRFLFLLFCAVLIIVVVTSWTYTINESKIHLIIIIW